MSGEYKINNVDVDEIFEPQRTGFSSVTLTGFLPSKSYMSRTGDAVNANPSYFKDNGTLYDIHPKGYLIPKSLSYSGTWGAQTEGSAVNTSGITFTVTYMDDTTATVTPSVSPSSWATGSGSQTATFSYTEHGASVSTTKTCSMTYSVTVTAGTGGSASGSTTYEYSSFSQTKSISYSASSGYTFSSWSVSGGSASASGTTLTINGGSRGDITVTANFVISSVPYTRFQYSQLVFYSVSGLYTDSACTSAATTNTYYNRPTFYKPQNGSVSGVAVSYSGMETGSSVQSYAPDRTNMNARATSIIKLLDSVVGVSSWSAVGVWSCDVSGSSNQYYGIRASASSFTWKVTRSASTKYAVAFGAVV